MKVFNIQMIKPETHPVTDDDLYLTVDQKRFEFEGSTNTV